MRQGTKSLFLLIVITSLFTACKKSGGGSGELDSATGWEYNNPEYGGFEKLDYEGQVTGPNLVLVELYIKYKFKSPLK